MFNFIEHRSKRPAFLAAVVIATVVAAAHLHGEQSSAEGFLERYAATYRFRLGKPTRIKVTPDGKAVLFVRSGPRSFVRDLYELDVASGREKKLLSSERLLGGGQELLSAAEKARRERMRLVAKGIATFELSEDGRRVLVPLGERLFVLDRATGEVRELTSDAGSPLDARFSPDAAKVACVRNGELYVTEIDTGRERQLTRGAGPLTSHGLAEFVAQEEMRRYHGYWWSPDSRSIVYQRTDTTGLEVMNLVDVKHPEKSPDAWPYPRPGKPNAVVRLGIVSLSGGPTTWIDWDHERYEYLAAVEWRPGAPLTLLVQNREQTEQRLLAVDTRDGSTTTLLVERDPAWIDLDAKMPYWLPEGDRFLWTTERNGGWQLELRGRDGTLQRSLTDVSLGLREFEHFHPASGEAIVRASADPTRSQLYRVSLDDAGERPAPLTSADGFYDAVSKGTGPVFVYHVVTRSGESRYGIGTRDGPTATWLRSVAEDPGLRPDLEFTTVGESPRFHAVLVRPLDFDRQKRYPVIVHVYGGPTSQMVQRNPSKYLLDQWIADHGYVVVAIDGRGTPGRGRDWQRTVKRDLIGIPLEDQARGLRLLGERYEELDLERVGIYGWSFGGYFASMAVLREPGLFRAGVAGAPVVAWEDYDTHYTERYMDLPQDNAEGYAAANVLTYADRLSRPLLLIHGTVDDNVYFLHSLKLADALFRAGKDFDFLPLPGFTHMVPDPLVTRRLYGRIMSFFDEHLQPRPGT